MPGKGVANFINPINANICLFTWTHSWGWRGCVMDSSCSVPRAGPWHRSTAAKQAVSMPLDSLICQNRVSSHHLGEVCWCLSYGREFCGGVFLGPGQRCASAAWEFGFVSVALAVSPQLCTGKKTRHCTSRCTAEETTRRKKMRVHLALAPSKHLLRLLSDTWYHHGQNVCGGVAFSVWNCFSCLPR